jgi:acyl-CoA thioesterase-1
MKTTYEMRPDQQERFLKIARETVCTNGIRPERFTQLLETNIGLISLLTRSGLDEHNLERKNPVIVALGDSVTAGHFENLFDIETFSDVPTRMAQGLPLEIVDPQAVYHEQFRLLLAEQFPSPSVSVINAGIAGDHILGMRKRVYRDVIRYQPDLVLINGSLNWGEQVGTLDDFRLGLTGVVQSIKENTQADIVLLTPNAVSDLLPDPQLATRVECIRALAKQEQVSLVDVYRLWCAFSTDLADFRALLTNQRNHPTAVGHTVYALALMQLFERKLGQ